MTLTAYTADGRAKTRGQTYAPNGVVCRAKATVDGGVPGGTFALTTHLNTKVFDPFNFFNTANCRFQPTIPGYYRCTFGVIISGLGSSVEVDTFIRKNGSSLAAEAGSTGPSIPAGWFGNTITALVYLNGTTDYVDLAVYTPAAASIRGTANQPAFFDAELVASSLGVAPEPWHVIGATGEPAFQNGWTHFDQPNGRVARFMKDPHGFVHLDGVIKSGTTGTAAFTLPVGYRPSQVESFAPPASPVGSLDISAVNGGVAPTGGGSYMYLSGVTYRSEQ